MRTLGETLNVYRQIPAQSDAPISDSLALDIGRASPTALTNQLNEMRVAIVHHWLISRAGGERVFDAIASIFPTADVFTLFLDKQKLPPWLHKRKITTSFIDGRINESCRARIQGC